MDSAVHFELPYQDRKQKVREAGGKVLGEPMELPVFGGMSLSWIPKANA